MIKKRIDKNKKEDKNIVDEILVKVSFTALIMLVIFILLVILVGS
jgi:hypothetical protein